MVTLSIVSWNVLADCYSRGAPSCESDRYYEEVDVHWDKRSLKIKSVLRNIHSDIFCMQEVDHFQDFYSELFVSMDFESYYFQRPEKEDGCLIAFNKNNFRCIEYQPIQFDDLSNTLTSCNTAEYYRRHNVGQIILLEYYKDFNQSNHETKLIIVVNCHLFWNPEKEEIKIAQIQFLKEKLQNFIKNIDSVVMSSVRIVIAGDFNSLPSSDIYYNMTLEDFFNTPVYVYESKDGDRKDNKKTVVYDIRTSHLTGPTTRFICDANLNRLCRWMRVLGIDTALESSESAEARGGKARPAHKYSQLFTQARDEKRVLLTGSKRMLQLSSCPQSFLVPPGKLETVLVSIVKEFSLILNPEKFLTVCGKCGGDIEACGSSDPRLHELSGKIPDDKPIFMCVLCNQPYWWNENENSRSSRALSLADRLFTSIQTGIGQPVTSVKRDLSGNVSRDTTTTTSTTTSTSSTATAAAGDMSDSKHEECAGITTSILNSYQNLSDIAGLESTNKYVSKYKNITFSSSYCKYYGTEPEYTNKTRSFSGTLDYIFVSNDVEVLSSEVNPCIGFSASITAVEKKNQKAQANMSVEDEDHITAEVVSSIEMEKLNIDGNFPLEYFPNNIWPSDHLLIKSTLEF